MTSPTCRLVAETGSTVSRSPLRSTGYMLQLATRKRNVWLWMRRSLISKRSVKPSWSLAIGWVNPWCIVSTLGKHSVAPLPQPFCNDELHRLAPNPVGPRIPVDLSRGPDDECKLFKECDNTPYRLVDFPQKTGQKNEAISDEMAKGHLAQKPASPVLRTPCNAEGRRSCRRSPATHRSAPAGSARARRRLGIRSAHSAWPRPPSA